MGCGEVDMLRCRVHELRSVPNLIHVVVEADVDHQGNPKPFRFADHIGEFDPDRVRFVWATGLPDSPNAWHREHAQREFVRDAMFDAESGDVVLHGDIDEIPTATFAANVKPRGFVVAQMRFHPFAVDWQHPDDWCGTVAGRYQDITSFATMRDARMTARPIPRSGWHLSWVGGTDYALSKLSSCAHSEIREWTEAPITKGDLWRHGYHVDGQRLTAVDVDTSWPEWVRSDACPPEWFRPRDAPRVALDLKPGAIVKFA